MNTEIENKIKSYCKNCNMDIDNLEIIPVDDEYLVKDKNTKMIFDKNGNVTSLPMHCAYGIKTTNLLGKYSSILIYVVFIIALLYVFIAGFMNK
ncbi:MAG: hypothetical protein ACI398_03970 [Clostridium sp.]